MRPIQELLFNGTPVSGDRHEASSLSVDGLLTIFRIATISRVVIALVVLLVLSTTVGEQNLGRFIAAIDALLLAIYLSATPLQRLFRDRYLPIALIWTATTPMLTSLYTMYFFFNTPMGEFRQEPIEQVGNFVVLSNVAQTLAILLIPLVIVSWRYTRKSVIQFCVATSVVESALLVLFIPLSAANLTFALSLIAFRFVVLLLVGLMVNLLVTVQRAQARALRDANARLQDYAATREQLIVSQERNRLARELHDTLAHTLAASSLQLEAVQVIWAAQPERARILVEESAAIIRGGLRETRRALQALRADPLESVGLAASIRLLTESIEAHFKVSTTIEAAVDVSWLSEEQEHVIYRVTQEALVNSAQHAQAQQIKLRIEDTVSALRVAVIDDGVGFDPSSVDTSAHLGVRGMRERAALIGAEFKVSSGIGQGTLVEMLFKREPDENSSL